jgi:hypothetical protein
LQCLEQLCCPELVCHFLCYIAAWLLTLAVPGNWHCVLAGHAHAAAWWARQRQVYTAEGPVWTAQRQELRGTTGLVTA